MHAAIQDTEIVGEPEWKAAVNGDAAAAIGVAIRLAVKSQASKPVVDLAMTGVLAAAIQGDCTAQHFLSHMLNKRGAAEFAASWIEASRFEVRDLKVFPPSLRMRPPRSRWTFLPVVVSIVCETCTAFPMERGIRAGYARFVSIRSQS